MKASTVAQYVTIMAFGGFTSHLGLTYRTWQFYVLLALVVAYGMASAQRAKS